MTLGSWNGFSLNTVCGSLTPFPFMYRGNSTSDIFQQKSGKYTPPRHQQELPPPQEKKVSILAFFHLEFVNVYA